MIVSFKLIILIYTIAFCGVVAYFVSRRYLSERNGFITTVAILSVFAVLFILVYVVGAVSLVQALKIMQKK